MISHEVIRDVGRGGGKGNVGRQNREPGESQSPAENYGWYILGATKTSHRRPWWRTVCGGLVHGIEGSIREVILIRKKTSHDCGGEN
jgi:hypothetical protein